MSDGICKTSGLGPRCEHSEKGDGRREDCLRQVRTECLAKLNKCISQSMMDYYITYMDFTGRVDDTKYRSTLNAYHQETDAYYQWLFGGDTTLNSWTIKGDNSSTKDNVKRRVSQFVNCFRTVDCNWRQCYCNESICEGPVLDAGTTTTDPAVPNTDSTTNATDGPPPTSTTMVTYSSYGLPIPLVYGTHLVAGNVIWIGDTNNVTTYTYNSGKSTPETVTTIDLLLGLCEGPIAGIGRIWLDDVLVYDARSSVAGTPIIRASTFGVDATSMTNSALTASQLTVYTGEEDQAAVEDGIGYRGLACLRIKNFGLSTTGRIPQFRVEVIRKVTASTSITTADVGDIDTLYFDARTDTLIVMAPGTIATSNRRFFKLLKLSTLELLDTVYFNFNTDVAIHDINDPGYAFISAEGKVRYVNLPQQIEFTSVTGSFNGGVVTDVLRTASNKPERMLIAYAGLNARYVSVSKETGDVVSDITHANVFPAVPSSSCVSSRILHPESGVPTYVDEVLFFCMSGSLSVYSSELQRTPLASFPEGAPVLRSTIPSALWGGGSGTLKTARALSSNGDVILGVQANGAFTVICYVPETQAIRWTAELPSVTSFTFYDYVGESLSIVAGSVIYNLRLSDGQVSTGETPSVLPSGAQYYNPIDGSLTYATSGTALRKMFIGRLASAGETLASMASDVALRAGVLYTDMGAVEDILIHGYAVVSDTTPRAIFEQTRLILPVEFSELGGALRCDHRVAHVDAGIVLDLDVVAPNAENSEAFALTDTADESFLQNVTVGYQKSDNGYAVSRQTMRQPMPHADNLTGHSQTYDTPFVLTDTEALTACERALVEDTQGAATASCVVGMRYSNLTPGDFVTVNAGGITLRGTVKGVTEEHGVRSQITLTAVEPTLYDDGVGTPPRVDDSITIGNDSIPLPTTRSVITLPVPPPKVDTGDNITANINPILIVVAPLATAMPVAGLDIYSDITGNQQKEGTVTAYPVIGTLRSIPVNRSSLFTTDYDNEIVISFRETQPFTAATHSELDADPKRNLLIVGKEYVQFESFTVDPDNKTYHFTGLRRGIYGTDYSIYSHRVGEACYVWDDNAVFTLSVRYKDNTSTSHSVAVGKTGEPLTWEKIPATYYGLRAWATTTLRRSAGATLTGGCAFFGMSRSSVTFDLSGTNTNLNAAYYTSIPRKVFAFPLLAPFDPYLFAQAVEGKITNYVADGIVTGTVGVPAYGSSHDSGRPRWDADSAGSIYAASQHGKNFVTDECEVAMVFFNPGTSDYPRTVIAERDYGFYIVFKFEAGQTLGVPQYVGTL